VNVSKTMVTGLAALAAAAALGACGGTGTKEASPSSAPTSSTQTATSAQASAHNQTDVDFATAMIAHHQQAVEMSDIVLAKQGVDPRVVDLATQIKAAQGPEITTMQGWLSQWGVAGTSGMPSMSGMPGMDHGGMHGGDSASPSTSMMPGTSMMPSGSMSPGMGMGGMMSSADMEALKNAQGAEASKLFLAGMIAHHQGALTMAQDEIANGQSADAIALAKSILDSQRKEIDTMNEILGSL
jgi:uncharacterized protein (DUF305 family)